MTIQRDYESYASKIGNRMQLYTRVKQAFKINKVLYPGSHIDIAPSLVFPSVTYIDNFKGTKNFFDQKDEVSEYIHINKAFNSDSELTYLNEDYERVRLSCQYDLLISLYAGFVSRACKRYLKQGGILLCNDSHGDATLAYLDGDFDFLGVIESNHKIKEKGLESYFTFARTRPIDKDKVLREMKGPKYKISANYYLFRKV